jgi:hypothetical protein
LSEDIKEEVEKYEKGKVKLLSDRKNNIDAVVADIDYSSIDPVEFQKARALEKNRHLNIGELLKMTRGCESDSESDVEEEVYESDGEGEDVYV